MDKYFLLNMKFTNEQKQVGIKRYKEGEKLKDICKDIGCSRSSLDNWLQKAGVNQTRHNPSTKIQEKALELYESGLSSNKIGRKLDVSGGTILRWIRNRTKIRHFKCSKKVQKKIVSLYKKGFSISYLANEYKIDYTTVENYIKPLKRDFHKDREHLFKLLISGFTIEEIAEKLNYDIIAVRKKIFWQQSRKYTLNDKFFEKIDTEEKAYWLGFILADGCIFRNSGNALRIGLARKDKAHLKKFLTSIKSDHKIYLNQTRDKKGCAIRLVSSKIFYDLIQLGIEPNKSLIAKPIKVRKDLQRHLWRGVFDGDGSLYNSDNGEIGITLCGTEAICTAFSQFIGCKGKYVYKQRNIFTTGVHGTGKMRKTLINNILNLLYQDAKIYLERKYNIYKKITLEKHSSLNGGNINGR